MSLVTRENHRIVRNLEFLIAQINETGIANLSPQGHREALERIILLVEAIFEIEADRIATEREIVRNLCGGEALSEIPAKALVEPFVVKIPSQRMKI